MSFGVLSVLVLAGIAGPLLAISRRVLVPVVVGELLAGLALGRSGFGWLHPRQPTVAFLADAGFAMLMFTVGMHVPLRRPELMSRVGRGGAAAVVAGALAAIAGLVTARAAGVPHAGVYAVVLGSGSAAVLVPSLDELELLGNGEALVVAAQVAIADVVSIVAVPLALRPSHALHALLGTLAVAACAGLVLAVLQLLHRTTLVRRIRQLSKKRAWALDLRLSLLVLFGLCWLATRSGTSILIAGFAVGLVVAWIGGPKRLSRQVTGVGQGFLVPLYFVVLGATIDVRELTQHGSLILLAVLLVVFDVGLHVATAFTTQQSFAAGLAATVQLGVPAAIVSLGLQQGILTAGQGAAIMVAAIASIAVGELGVALMARKATASGA